MIALLIVGDEILSGQVEDVNLGYMISRFSEAGYDPGEARIVRDDVNEIAEALETLTRRYDYVVSAGGVGPTHDDVTLEGAARAFGVPLEENAEMRAFLEEHYTGDFNETVRQMAYLPQNAEVIGRHESHWPIIRYGNCFLLPGVPVALRSKVQRILSLLPPLKQHVVGKLYVTPDESAFAAELKALQASHPEVSIGSYPIIGESRYRAYVTVKAKDEPAAHSVFATLRDYFTSFGWLVETEEPAAKESGTDDV
jgi:molybdenum cofactor synthesis domain-containing protein